MTKEELVELGLDEDQIKGVFKINGLDIEAVNTKNVDLRAKIKILEGKNSVLSTDLSGITKHNEDVAKLTADIGKLEAEKIALNETIEGLKLTNQEELDKLTYTHILDSSLNAAGVKSLKAIKALLDTDSIKLTDGKLEGLDEEIERLKESDSYMFENPSAPVVIKPSGGGGSSSKTVTQEQFDKMDYNGKLSIYNDNPTLYKTLTQ